MLNFISEVSDFLRIHQCEFLTESSLERHNFETFIKGF